MSVTFVPSANGGRANLAHVVSVDSQDRARMSDGSFVQLAENWCDDEEHIEFSIRDDLVCMLGRIEEEIRQARIHR